MFLDVICRRNPSLVTDAIALHRQGRIPANSYVIDLDTVRANARQLRQAGDLLDIRGMGDSGWANTHEKTPIAVRGINVRKNR